MPVQFQPASDQSLLVVFGHEINLENHRGVVGLLRLLQQQPVAGVRNLHPAYASLLVVFDPLRLRHAELESLLREYLLRMTDTPASEPRIVEIPVCYDKEFAIDLEEVAALCSLTSQQVIELHCSILYTVYFLGFVPGFAYLGDLPVQMAIPRLATPRRSVPRGSVAIAERQTGIYPLATPGGWRILGRTPLEIFRPHSKEMSLLNTSDQVRFVPISRARFDAWERT